MMIYSRIKRCVQRGGFEGYYMNLSELGLGRLVYEFMMFAYSIDNR
jgi:hypothetical protein